MRENIRSSRSPKALAASFPLPSPGAAMEEVSLGVDGSGDKYVLAVVEGATENWVVVQALLDNLTGRGLDPTVPLKPS